MPRTFRALLVLSAIAFCARADDWCPARAFRIFSKANYHGLPQSSVMGLVQDRDGLLWIATLDGVATFDGRTLAPVANVANAPRRGVITAIAAGAKNVYAASAAGVHLFDGTSWRLIATRKGALALAETSDGVLWMCDVEGSLWRLAGNKWHEVPLPAKAAIIAAGHDGSLWIATETTALRLMGSRIDAIPGALPGRPGTMIVAHDGRVWVSTLAGTIHWSNGASGWQQAPFTPWPRAAFRSMAEDRRGRIWLGAYGGGPLVFGNAELPWTIWDGRNVPFEGGVNAILPDREGNLWFGLNAIGLTQWIGEPWSHRTVADPSSPVKLNIAAFGLSRGAQPHTLLVSLFQSGFLKLSDGAPRRYDAADGLTNDVRHVVEPEPGFFIAGTRFGIYEAKPGEKFRQVLTLPSGFVMGLFRSPDGRWFAGSSTQGVFVRDDNGWHAVDAINRQLPDLHVRDMKWNAKGELWIATLRGIAICRGDAVEQLTSRTNGAIPDSVNAILFANDETWIGGIGGAAVLRNGKWLRYGEADGLPGPTIYSLARGRDGAIWAGGSAGAGRFLGGKWTAWDSREGLIQEECNLNGLIVDDDGSVYFGTMSGLARFDPHVAPVPEPPLTLRWRAEPAAERRALHLKWTAAYLSPQPLQYRVRLPRLREAWSAPSSEEHLDVENLGAGTWRVEVQARVEGSARWSAPLVADVSIPPFWYETIPARAAFALLVIGIIYALVRLRLRALHHHAAMLEAVVRERTAELRESEQRALAASRAKSAFLANMSHELRTPLNGVLGFAQLMMRRRNRDPEDREGLEIIIKSGEHLLGLINDVLSLSKIEAGRVTVEREAFDLATLVHDVENVLRMRAEEKGLRMTCTLEGEALPHAVMGDPGKLRQILLNLLGNAVKFTEHGFVTLRVHWSGDRAAFEVEDSGPGIAESEMARLFEPFVQTESGQRTKEGTGLGLALSRDLARLMSGDIQVKSEIGHGSTFTLDVPLPAAGVEAAAVENERRRVIALADGHPPVRLLVVDDTALNRAVLTRLLASAGFEVREAANGEEALEMWQHWRPHFIWMDKRMQGMDGLEVTRRIRARERHEGRARVPIIALSASALEHERREILAAGCDDFVAKPFRESLLFAKLKEHLGVEYSYESQPRRVLVVDDDRICRQVAEEILRAQGVKVTLAASGTEAVEIASRTEFDLVLMDVQMPGMDGVEATRRIRLAPGRERLPIIAMSADDAPAAGVDDQILKPVEPDALTHVIDRWIGLRSKLETSVRET